MQNVEQRSVATSVRNTGTTEAPKIRGYGIVYDSLSSVLTEDDEQKRPRRFRERIMPGAARRSLAEADLRVLAHHDKTRVLGRRNAGTARFGEDARGVWYEADPPDTTYGRDIVVNLSRGDVDGSSFSFAPIRDEWSEPDADGVQTRTIHEMHVFEMGPVSWPAYSGARAVYRDDAPAGDSSRKLEPPDTGPCDESNDDAPDTDTEPDGDETPAAGEPDGDETQGPKARLIALSLSFYLTELG